MGGLLKNRLPIQIVKERFMHKCIINSFVNTILCIYVLHVNSFLNYFLGRQKETRIERAIYLVLCKFIFYVFILY